MSLIGEAPAPLLFEVFRSDVGELILRRHVLLVVDISLAVLRELKEGICCRRDVSHPQMHEGVESVIRLAYVIPSLEVVRRKGRKGDHTLLAI